METSKVLFTSLLALCLISVSCRNNTFLISKNQLPAGWEAIPTDQMPPNDKMPWWTTNPMKLSGDEAKQFLLDASHPSHAVEINAAAYQNENEALSVIIFLFTYHDQQTADSEFKAISQSMDPNMGRITAYPNKIMYISWDKGASPADINVFERQSANLVK